MSNKDHETCVKLAEWYAAIHPRRIDIVGDFGGKQLFLIDGDSLLHYSVTTSKVDYDGKINMHRSLITIFRQFLFCY